MHGRFPSSPSASVCFGTSVILSEVSAGPFLSPMGCQSLLKNWKFRGAVISWSVHPRENHSSQPLDLGYILTLRQRKGARDVMKVRIAYPRVCIPPIHQIDGLRQLCTASLVDAASVHPHPLIPVLLCLLAGINNLLIAQMTTDFLLLPIHLGKVDHLFIVNFCETNPPIW